MYFNAEQTQQALQAGQRPQPQRDQLPRVVETVALVMFARSVSKLFQKQAADGTHRCW